MEKVLDIKRKEEFNNLGMTNQIQTLVLYITYFTLILNFIFQMLLPDLLRHFLKFVVDLGRT